MQFLTYEAPLTALRGNTYIISLISSTIAFIGFGYNEIIRQREEELSTWKALICNPFKRNALAGPEALEKFPKSSKVFRADAIILGMVLGFAGASLFTDLPLAVGGGILGGFVLTAVSNQRERDAAALEKLRNVYTACLRPSQEASRILGILPHVFSFNSIRGTDGRVWDCRKTRGSR